MSASEYVKQLQAEIVEEALEERTSTRQRRQRLLRVRYR
ncbi:hypothetical protein JOD67_004730 [Tenggerimyces flavus]|nr:hypothetical protein [Tenggerimyces flavus]